MLYAERRSSAWRWAGTWAFSVGWLLLADRPRVGRLLVVVGIWAWALALTTMLGIHSLALLGAGLLAGIAAWIVWVALGRSRPAPGA